MRWREIQESMGATTSGGIATVAMPLGVVQTRNGGNFFSGAKYTNDLTPNTPKEYKKGKRRVK